MVFRSRFGLEKDIDFDHFGLNNRVRSVQSDLELGTVLRRS